MKKFLQILIFLFAPILAGAQTVTVSGATTFQTMEGFGGQDYQNASALNTSATNFFFGQTTGTVGGTSYPSLGFQIIRTSNYFNGTIYDLTSLQNAVAAGAKVELGLQSPPCSIKHSSVDLGENCTSTTDNGWIQPTAFNDGVAGSSGTCFANSLSLDGTGGAFDQYATYIVNLIHTFQNSPNNIPITYLDVQNEANITASNLGGCIWGNGSQFQDFIKNYLGPKLSSAGLSSIKVILGPAYNWNGTDFVTACMNDSSCSPYVYMVGGHGYGYPFPPTVPNSSWLNKPRGLTETAEQGTSVDSGISGGLTWANNIYGWLTLSSGGTNYGLSLFEWWDLSYPYGTIYGCSNCGLSDSLDGGSGNLVSRQPTTPAKRAFTEGQFSRFIQQGWVRVAATGGAGNVNNVAFKNPSTGAFSIVSINNNSSSTAQTYSLSGGLSASSVTPYITDGSNNIAQQSPITVSGGSFSTTLNANSVTTFYFAGGGVTNYSLTVGTSGTGTGVVSGTNCSTNTYASGTAIGPCTATPNSGSTFSGWSGGGCSGTGTCSLTLTGNTTITASFTSSSNTYTSATCSQADVNTIINGPTHVAVNGDTIVIKAGTCTWTSGISFSGKGFTITGQGSALNTLPTQFTPASSTTNIIQNTSQALFSGSSIPVGQTMHYELLNLSPQAGLTNQSPAIQNYGICNGSGCPNIRVDNVTFGDWTNDASAATTIVNDLFGVYDHNSVTGSGQGAPAAFAQISFSAWQGIGDYGDNSFSAADTFGTTQAFYIENNTLNNARGTENDVGFGGLGGDRVVVRYNILNNASAIGLFNSHGTAWTGRDRGSRQKEVYRNTLNCVYSGGCGGGSFNSGTGFVFQNHYVASSPGFFNNYFTVDSPRRWRALAMWGYCAGAGNYDTNDGTVYATGSVTSSTGSSQMTDASKSWTSNQWSPAGNPYSIWNTTQSIGGEISSNTATVYNFSSNGPYQQTWNTSSSYQILRASVCLDQAGRSGGTLLAGTSGPNGGPTPTGSNNQTLDPIYEFADTSSGGFGAPVTTQVSSLIANRDWYSESTNQAAQSSPSSPFNGTSGTGHGTLSNRPTTCTAGTGYWATDQGTWNQSGNGDGSGIFYKCTSTNTWTLNYTPLVYPHPLIGAPSTTFSLTTSTAGTGSGSVSGSNCSTGTYATGTAVGPCTATPSSGSTFAGWSGTLGCTGTSTCSGTLTANSTVVATFTLTSYTLTVNISGSGTGVITGSNCSAGIYPSGTVIGACTATPNVGSSFVGWSNACSGFSCGPFSLTSNTIITANFIHPTTNPFLTQGKTVHQGKSVF